MGYQAVYSLVEDSQAIDTVTYETGWELIDANGVTIITPDGLYYDQVKILFAVVLSGHIYPTPVCDGSLATNPPYSNESPTSPFVNLHNDGNELVRLDGATHEISDPKFNPEDPSFIYGDFFSVQNKKIYAVPQINEALNGDYEKDFCVFM